MSEILGLAKKRFSTCSIAWLNPCYYPRMTETDRHKLDMFKNNEEDLLNILARQGHKHSSIRCNTFRNNINYSKMKAIQMVFTESYTSCCAESDIEWKNLKKSTGSDPAFNSEKRAGRDGPNLIGNEAKCAAKDREEWKLRVEASCSSWS